MQLARVIRSSLFVFVVVTVAVLAATGIVNPVAAQTTILFDFESPPDNGDIDPQFTDPATGFVLSHTAGAVRGNAQWDDGPKCIPHTGVGCMRISDLGVGATPTTATVNFSEPVESVSLWAFSFSLPATITPIVEGGGLLAPIAITNVYTQYEISGEGPYVGLLLSAPAVNVFNWDDLEVSLSPPEIQRDSLLGAETETTNLLAVGPVDGTGAVIGATGIFPFTALAKDPSSGVVYGGGIVREEPILYTYQTIVEFNDSLDGIDTAVIDWITPVNSGFVGEGDLTYLSIALLDGPNNLYTDISIIGGVPQPLGGAPRTIADIFWDFDHNTNKLSQLFNASIAVMEASAGTQYLMSDGDDFDLDGGTTRLDRYQNGDETGVDLSMGTTQDTRLLRIEHAPSLYEIEEFTGVSRQIGILGEDIISFNAADFDEEGQLWAALTVEDTECEGDCDPDFEALATIDKTDGSATVVGAFGGGAQCIEGISFDRNGTLLGVSSCNDELYQIDLNDGSATFVTEVFVGEGGPIPGDGFTSLQFTCDNTLFAGTGQQEFDGGDLYRVNSAFGESIKVGAFGATDGSGLGALAVHTTCVTSISTTTPPGTNVPVASIIGIEVVAAEVVVEGETNIFNCVGRDARWEESEYEGEGFEFTARTLMVSELSGTGSCAGPLSPGSSENWEEDIFPFIDLTISSRFRSYPGEFTIPGDLEPTEDYWLVLSVQKTGAEFSGVVAVETIPEDLIDYSNMDPETTPGCDRDPDWRTVDVAGTVDQFGEVQNVEGENMIIETAQCNRPRGLTRRTTHVYPVRIQDFGETNADFQSIMAQISGIEDTVAEAAFCADPVLLASILSVLEDAEEAFDEGRYGHAQERAEQVARLAKESPAAFGACPVPANYRGNLMGRGLTLAFSFHDRYEHAEEFEIYLVPLDLDIPLLRPTSPDAPDAPINLNGRAKLSHVNLGWSAANNAASYTVYRRLDTENNFTPVDEVTTLAFVDDLPAGVASAEYYVVAENAFGDSGPSNVVTVAATARRRR